MWELSSVRQDSDESESVSGSVFPFFNVTDVTGNQKQQRLMTFKAGVNVNDYFK